MNLASDDPESSVRIAALAQSLQELGWVVGRNVQIDTRWAAGDPERFRRYAAELVAAPLTLSWRPALRPLRRCAKPRANFRSFLSASWIQSVLAWLQT
jgi:hypothetical protein